MAAATVNAAAAALSQPVICVVGPTASGKTDVAQLIATRLDGEVVSADSMQVYRGMDIGTGKVPVLERRVPHHGLDLVDPGEPYSAALFQDYARRCFEAIDARSGRSILAGGTGLYVRAAVDDCDFPQGDQTENPVRERWTAFAEENGAMVDRAVELGDYLCQKREDVLAAYLCCQLRRWVALLVIAMVPGIDWLQPAVEMVVTLPLLAVLLRYVAPAARSFARYPRSMQLLFGVVPLAGYLFDYVTRIYTDLLAQGNQAAVEFMPFVCSVAYIVFVLRVSAEERTRGQLEQTRNNLKLQVGQAVREIEALRTSQQQTRAYRHDLRHHLQYISACIENGRGEQAQEYIQSICSEIEASKVTTYCENEAANLIFSSFAGRAENCGVPLNIQAHIPQLISVVETDLCVLLSNALENALRACRRMKAENGPAYIEVTAREKNGHLFLQFVNPCPEGIQFENGLPVTHAEGHGIGVRSICAIVEKYKGLSDFSVQDGRFILRVSL